MPSVKHENPAVFRTSVGYFYLTDVAADTETVTVANRVYEFDTHLTGEITAGNVRVDINADQTEDAACTALAAAVNADTAAKVDAVVMAGNSDTTAGVTFVGRHHDVGNVALATTCGDGVVSAAALTGYVARKDYSNFSGSYTVTAADVTLWAKTGGNEVVIAVIPTTTDPTITGILDRTSSDVVVAPAGLVVKTTQVNSNFYAIIVEDGSATLTAADVLTWTAVV